jgi:methanogenic corrinoid protein MtbC1
LLLPGWTIVLSFYQVNHMTEKKNRGAKTVVAAALGECVHVAGVIKFLRLAEAAGWRTVFLGPATPAEKVLAAARTWWVSLTA